MTKNIEPSLKLISEYLAIKSDEKFVIPEYQRRYSWSVIECDKLWQDIEAFMGSETINESGRKEPYFFGTIIDDCSASGVIKLIDGQQRTTTFILLMKALLLRLQEILNTTTSDDDNESLLDGLKERRNAIVDVLYRTDADSRREFLANPAGAKGIAILESLSINELDSYKRDLQTIVEAPDYQSAEKGCYKIPKKQKDNKYTNFFRNFKFFVSKLSDYSESKVNAFARTFLKECQIIEIRSWSTEQAITMFNSLNSTGMPLSDADIISAQLYSNAGNVKDEFVTSWEELNRVCDKLAAAKIVSIDSILQQYMYIRRAEDKVYIREGSQPDVTTPGIRRYYTVDSKELLKEPLELCKRFRKIADTWEFVREFPIVKLLLKFNENAKLYLIAYLNRFPVSELNENAVVEVGENLLRLFALLELVDTGYSSAKFKTFLFGENIKLVDVRMPVDVISADFARHINATWQPEEIKNSLEAYDKNILVFLNEYLYAKEHSLAFNFADNVNIEHIMPASGHNIEIIRQDAGIDSREEFLSIVNKLGNKILLEEDINKSIGNDWFKTKKQKSVTDKAGYKDSRYHIALALTHYIRDEWGKKDIENATKKASGRILSFIFGKAAYRDGDTPVSASIADGMQWLP